MNIEVRSVTGADFAGDGSQVLMAAWAPPSLRYSPQYVEWQLTFPGPCEAPAVAAFEGRQTVGFAASTHRRVFSGGHPLDLLVVTFVAVDPRVRGQGIAHRLYAALLSEIRRTGLPVITYGRSNSSGQRAIEQAYPLAGFSLSIFGEYAPYATIPRTATSEGWSKSTLLPPIPQDGDFEYSAPTPEQFAHYFRDPRGRHLWAHEGGGWAWATEVEFVSPKGVETVTSLESITGVPIEALPGLAAAAGQGKLVHAPNLLGYTSQELRPLGFRQTTAAWIGYCAGRSTSARGINLEII